MSRPTHRKKGVHSILVLSLDGQGTLLDQLVRALRDEIERSPLGARLPSTRALALDLKISRNVVVDAYGELANHGLVTGRHGGGSYVTALDSQVNSDISAEREAQALASTKPAALSQFGQRLQSLDASPILERPELQFDFRYGLPIVAEFPFGSWARIVAKRAMIGGASVLGYGYAAGYQPLREALADYLRRARGIVCDVEQIVVTNGSQQALDLIARILIDAGDRVVLEEPHYEGARQAFSVAGARIVPVPVDRDGLQIEKLPTRSSGLRAVYVTPSHQFPTGAVLSSSRRGELLRWATKHECFVIEDDYDAELRYDIRPIQAIKGIDTDDQVIYVGTLSKVLFPSLRLGYLVSPRRLVETLVRAKHVCDRQTPMLLQMALADFMAEGHFDRHLLRARRLCAQRRVALLAAVERCFGSQARVEGANAGIHVILWIDNRSAVDVPEIVERAACAGVGIYPVAPYYMQPPTSAGFLLGYASMDEHRIAEGIERLATVLK